MCVFAYVRVTTDIQEYRTKNKEPPTQQQTTAAEITEQNNTFRRHDVASVGTREHQRNSDTAAVVSDPTAVPKVPQLDPSYI